MGYTTDTEMSQFIPPAAIARSAGTWTDGITGNVPNVSRAAGAAAFNLFIPILIPSNASLYKGSRLKSIDVFYTVGVAALNSVTTVELEVLTLPVNPVAPSGFAAITTVDLNHDTTAKRVTVASHTLTVSLATPVFITAGNAYVLYLTFDAALTSTFVLQGARANYDLRI